LLVLSRKPGEAIIIDDDVSITVLSIKGRQVRVGISAPANVVVHRDEVYKRIKDADTSQAKSNLEEDMKND